MRPTSILRLSEAAKYTKVWKESDYRIVSHSVELWKDRRELFPTSIASALDIGCGLGMILPVWNEQGIDAWGIDIAPNCLDIEVSSRYCHKFVCGCVWSMEWDRVFDFGICTDVMEHIPPDKVLPALQAISQCCNEVLFKIDHISNEFIGEILHLTIKPVEWWIELMNSIGGRSEFVGTSARGGGVMGSIVKWKIPR